MSEKIRELYKELARLPSEDYFPDFVINNEIKKRDIGTGDYKPQLDHRWSEDTFYRFDFGKTVTWDHEKSEVLYSTIPARSRWENIHPKRSSHFIELLTREQPQITRDMTYNNFLILDKKGYEKSGVSDMIKVVERNYLDYKDAYSEESAENKAEAERWITERLACVIDSNSMTTSFAFLQYGSDLLERIGSKFFGAKTE